MGNLVENLEPAEIESDVCILDSAPNSIHRLLNLQGGRGYLATWVYVQRTVTEKDGKPLTEPTKESHQELIILRDDRKFYSDAPIPKAEPLNKMGLIANLKDIPASNLLLSGSGVNRFLSGEKPDVVSVFNDVCDIIDGYMDFHGSFGSQSEMSEFIACYVLSTYLLDAFPVTGYLWPNGEPGSGKSHLLHIISTLTYLGQYITAGGSFASIRDLAGYGATLCFDDAEKIMDKNGDADKQSLLLAGNRKGVTVPMKVPSPNGRTWSTVHINAYCPRCFSAVGLPNDTLSSRTIFIPLLGSDDSEKANSDPFDFDSWSVDRKRLIDDLWMIALTNIKKIPALDKQAVNRSGMAGRSLQPWRAILGTALWLESEGVTGLFETIKGLTEKYRNEDSFSSATHKTIVLRGLREIVNRNPGKEEVKFTTRELRTIVNMIALNSDLMDDKRTHDGELMSDYITSKSLGWRLSRMRLKRPDGRNPAAREWRITRAELERLERSNGIPSHVNVTNVKNVKTSQGNDIYEVSDKSDINSEGYRAGVRLS